MIRRVLRLAAVGAVVGWGIDRWLASRGLDPRDCPIVSTVKIRAPIDDVWREIGDIEAQPRWMLDLTSVRILTPGPIGEGTRAIGRVRILGIAVDDPITITAFEPPSRFAIRHEGAFKGEGVITLEAGATTDTTVVRWEETLVAPVLPHLGAVVGGQVLGRVFQSDLERLRLLFER